MKQLNPGKLYKINEYSWLLFPSKEAAAANAAWAVGIAIAAGRVAAWTSYWSKQLGCNVSFLNEGDTFLVVEVSDIQVKVINQEGKSGWINFPIGGDENWTEGTIT